MWARGVLVYRHNQPGLRQLLTAAQWEQELPSSIKTSIRKSPVQNGYRRQMFLNLNKGLATGAL